MDYSKLSITEIAREIQNHMNSTKQTAYGCVPYLQAMKSLNSVDDDYVGDSGRSIVAYFLCNAQTLKGGEMPAIKKELNKRIK